MNYYNCEIKSITINCGGPRGGFRHLTDAVHFYELVNIESRRNRTGKARRKYFEAPDPQESGAFLLSSGYSAAGRQCAFPACATKVKGTGRRRAVIASF